MGTFFRSHRQNPRTSRSRRLRGLLRHVEPDGQLPVHLSGVEVAEASTLPEQFRWVHIPAQKYVIFPYRELVSRLRYTVDTIWSAWFPESSHKAARPVAGAPDFFERYGEDFDPQLGMGDVEVLDPGDRVTARKRVAREPVVVGETQATQANLTEQGANV